jgi:hypothetical protein
LVTGGRNSTSWVRSEATLRRDKWIDLADIHFALRVKSYRFVLAKQGL